jgi:hypothetical protein
VKRCQSFFLPNFRLGRDPPCSSTHVCLSFCSLLLSFFLWRTVAKCGGLFRRHRLWRAETTACELWLTTKQPRSFGKIKIRFHCFEISDYTGSISVFTSNFKQKVYSTQRMFQIASATVSRILILNSHVLANL